MKINTIIVEDELNAGLLLAGFLKEHTDIEVIKIARSVNEALKAINNLHPDLLFLDVELGTESCFDLLHSLQESPVHPEIIFVTGYEHYAIEAIRHAALDYLVKPVSRDELGKALERYRRKVKDNIKSKLEILFEHIRGPRKILFNTRSGAIYMDPSEIFYCEADGNYTQIFTRDKRTEFITCQLGQVFSRVSHLDFIRLGRSYILNKKYITRIERQKKTVLFENNGHRESLSLSHRLMRDLASQLED